MSSILCNAWSWPELLIDRVASTIFLSLSQEEMSIMCFFTKQKNQNLHYPLIMRSICNAMPIVYVLLVISAHDIASVSWWSDLSFLSQSNLKKYVKLCTNISG